MKKRLIILIVILGFLGIAWQGGYNILWKITNGNTLEPAKDWDVSMETIEVKNPNATYKNVKMAMKADTLQVLPSSGSVFFDLTRTTVLFAPGTFNIDDLQPATNDSSSSQVGASNNPYGAGYFVGLNAIGNITGVSGTFNGKLKTTGIFQYGLGYMGTADTVIVGGVKYAPEVGMSFVDTSGSDTLKCYLRGAWQVIQ